MKKILTILTVALLACTTVFAALNVSGEFEGGYTFSFPNGSYKAESQDSAEGKVTFKVTDDAGIWTVNVKSLSSLDSSNKLGANLSLNMAALLAANGVDLGDVSLALSLGANSKMTALSAYNDVTGDELYKFKNAGTYSAELAVGYGDLIQTKIALDPKTANKTALVISALTKPVDGVAVSLAYGHHAYFNPAAAVIEIPEKSDGFFVKDAVSIAADVNVGELAGLDFTLGVTVYDHIGFDYGIEGTGADNKPTNVGVYTEGVYNSLATALYGGVDVVDAFVEFRMDNLITEAATTTKLGLKTQVNLNVVENLGLDVYFNIGDFDAPDTSYAVGGDASYTISGVKFAANLEYGATVGFSVTPKIVVAF